MALEYFLPPRRDDRDESLASFVTRRFGREAFERIVQPLVGGIYTANAERLSIEATMPRFRRMEREYGSVLRAMARQRRCRPAEASGGARYGQFVALRGGMSMLVQALAARLPYETVQLSSPVARIVARDDARWRITIGGVRPRQLDVDGVIVAAAPRHAAALVHGCSAPLARSLSAIGAASCAVVSLGYRRAQFAHVPRAAGFVVPLVEQRLILSCSFSSEKYEGRAPEGAVLLRVFIGGASQSQLLELRRWQLVEIAEREVADLLGVRGEPILRHIVRQRRAMPQYHVGHREIVAAVNRQLADLPTLALAGNALSGVGIPSCIESGETAANGVLSNLRRSTLPAVPPVASVSAILPCAEIDPASQRAAGNASKPMTPLVHVSRSGE